jgi:hypothetical protein
MKPVVSNKGVISCESTLTDNTTKRFRARMRAHMARKMFRLGKAVFASTMAATKMLLA